MIVVQVADPALRRAVSRAVHVEEDVFAGAAMAAEAIDRGFPRLVVRVEGEPAPGVPPNTVLLEIGEAMLRRWEAEWRSCGRPVGRSEYLAERLGVLVGRASCDPTWVDRALADLTRAAGGELPLSLRVFARRILEYPAYYTTLHALADRLGMSRGALKARFRRRGLSSPSTYLRWFRIMAVAHLLSDDSVTVASAARRLGFTSSGNLCRAMADVADTTPTEAKTPGGWNRIMIDFARTYLSPESLDGWKTLDGLFERRVA